MLQLRHGALAQTFLISTEEAVYRKLQADRVEETMARRTREEKIDQDKKNEREFFQLMTAVTIAEMQAFRAELDTYDTAAVRALYDNEGRLADVKLRLEDMFGEAHVLPDGRKVFKTIDGTQVFDASGQALDIEIIDPSEIDDARPRWETVKSALDERERLLEERQGLHDFQGRLDEARERLDSGTMTREEFDDLRSELKADMPEAIRKHVPDMEQGVANHDAKAETAPKSEDLDLSSSMVPGKSGPGMR